jgi:hypothetical protein
MVALFLSIHRLSASGNSLIGDPYTSAGLSNGSPQVDVQNLFLQFIDDLPWTIYIPCCLSIFLIERLSISMDKF